MYLNAPRIAPLADDQMNAEQAKTMSENRSRPLNIFRTLIHSPEAFRGFTAWGSYILSGNDLTPRDREILVLRTGFLCKSGYEWTQHTRIALRCGLEEAEFEAIKDGPDSDHWSPAEKALLTAADELHDFQFINNATWAELSRHFTEKQRMDVVFTCGQYTQVSMILNSFGVQLDEGQTLDPDLKAG